MNQTVKIIKLINGDDIVTVLPTGEAQLPDNGPLIRLDKPLQIKYIPQMTPMGFRDYIALIRWTNYTGDKIVTIPKDKIMVIAKAAKELAHYYEVVLRKVKTQVKQKPLSPEEMEHIMQVAEEMDRQTKEEKIQEVSEMFGGYEIKSKKVH